VNKGNKNSEDRKFIKKCFHILWINSANETTPPLWNIFNRWGFFTFTVTITTNQLHSHYRNDIPFTTKEVSPLLIEYF
jgi:hypothetical protein